MGNGFGGKERKTRVSLSHGQSGGEDTSFKELASNSYKQLSNTGG